MPNRFPARARFPKINKKKRLFTSSIPKLVGSKAVKDTPAYNPKTLRYYNSPPSSDVLDSTSIYLLIANYYFREIAFLECTFSIISSTGSPVSKGAILILGVRVEPQVLRTSLIRTSVGLPASSRPSGGP